MEQRYWNSLLNNRIGRRRAMVATGATALGAAFLAACGGGDSGGSSGGSKESNSLVAKPVDTSKQAKKGGVLKDRNFGDPPSLDVIQATVSWNPFGFGVYSSLVQPAPGYLKPAGEELLPDIAESWETSPDGMTLTLKIRQNVKWHNKAPVNGRALTSDDLIYSWDRMAAKGSARSGIVNKVAPAAPMLSFTATDARTIQIKLKEPLVYALALLGGSTNGGLVIVPKETDGTFDPKQDMIGTGPFSLDKYTQSVGFTFKRNDEYWDKEWAYPDTIEMPIISEYAAALSQLKAGNIFRFAQNGSDIKAEDVLPLKRDEPRINAYLGEFGSAGVVGAILAFGWMPIDGKPTPMTDERVRQAMSMAIDRDTYMDTFHNVSNFAKEGIQIDSRWDSHLIASQEGWWLDPKGKDFGPNAKYFKFDLAEAKKLLAAAGFPSGLEHDLSYAAAPGLQALFYQHAEPIIGMIRDSGIFKPKIKELNYAAEWNNTFRFNQFTGTALFLDSAAGEPTNNLFMHYHTTGSQYFGGDSTLDDMVSK